MANRDHVDLSRHIVNRIEDPVRADPHAMHVVRASEPLASGAPWLEPERADSRHESGTVAALTNCFEFLRSTWLDEDPIACHVA